MKPFTTYSGQMVCMRQNNIDTDQILPKQFMKRIESYGYADCLFYDQRYQKDGSMVPEFILNHPGYKYVSILVGGDNFGCGSARQHAVWALRDFGFKVLIAPSFASNFYINCFNFGILAAIVSNTDLDLLQDHERQNAPNTELTVDLERQTISSYDEAILVEFKIDLYHRQCLMKGMDQIDATLSSADSIAAFESRQRRNLPWYWQTSETRVE
jgi:3-isopropylmalate/(R)-2-methylmalate dehydratase small subunit